MLFERCQDIAAEIPLLLKFQLGIFPVKIDLIVFYIHPDFSIHISYKSSHSFFFIISRVTRQMKFTPMKTKILLLPIYKFLSQPKNNRLHMKTLFNSGITPPFGFLSL